MAYESMESVVLSSLLLGLGAGLELKGSASSLVLEHARSHKTLDLWSLVLLLAGLGLELSADDELADIILLGEVEELANLGSSLWTKTTRDLGVGKTLDLIVTLADDGEVEDRKIWANDASADRLALALTLAAWAVARLALAQKKAYTAVAENTLLHWETLLVVTTSDAEDVSSVLLAEVLAINLLGDTAVVEDAAGI